MKILDKIHLSVTAAFLFLVGFVASSSAAAYTPLPDDAPILEFLKPVLEAVRQGHGWIAFLAGLIALSTVARRYLAPRIGFFRTKLGAYAIVFTNAYGVAALAALGAAGTHALTLSLAWSVALSVAIATSAYELIRPILQALAERDLGVFSYVVKALLYFFDSNPADAAVKEAEAAGEAAVQASPSQGIDGVTGKPTEIE